MLLAWIGTPRSFHAVHGRKNSELEPKGGETMLHRTVLAVAILATAISYAAKAETEAERQACFNDAQTHCGDYIPDRDRVASFRR